MQNTVKNGKETVAVYKKSLHIFLLKRWTLSAIGSDSMYFEILKSLETSTTTNNMDLIMNEQF